MSRAQRKFDRKKNYPCKLKRRKLPRGNRKSKLKCDIVDLKTTFEDIKKGLEKYCKGIEEKLNKGT